MRLVILYLYHGSGTLFTQAYVCAVELWSQHRIFYIDMTAVRADMHFFLCLRPVTNSTRVYFFCGFVSIYRRDRPSYDEEELRWKCSGGRNHVQLWEHALFRRYCFARASIDGFCDSPTWRSASLVSRIGTPSTQIQH
jgi:hypothetical protein